jgi:glycosyltransferase involved in cell wall biosynthesis
LARALVESVPDSVTLIGVRPDGPLADLEPRHVGSRLSSRRRHIAWVLRDADADSRRGGAVMAHWTNAIAPVRARLPFVLTIHDLSLLRLPHLHPPSRLAAIPLVAMAARRARMIVVPSLATSREVQRMLGIPVRRIAIVPEAPATGLDTIEASDAEQRRRRLGLREPYVASVGTREPRKNTARLVEAFGRIASQDPELRLVLVGPEGWRARGIERAIADSPHRSRILSLGYLGDLDLAAVIAGASVFAYVSSYEGFGLPVLEAMALHTPVVTSRVSALPETAGGAAVLVDPMDTGAIARGIAEALTRRDELVARGTARVASRDWSAVAADTVDVYRHVARSLDSSSAA